MSFNLLAEEYVSNSYYVYGNTELVYDLDKLISKLEINNFYKKNGKSKTKIKTSKTSKKNFIY